jgi:uncharacterized protein (TIGR03437 family)
MSACATLLIFTSVVFGASQPGKECGTQPARPQQELFLHQRHMVSRARGARFEPRAQTTGINQDVGDLAVLDDSGGVIGRRNIFDLDRRTLIFQPDASGYRLTVGGDTFDLAASNSGARLTLADDDTTAIALPFAFTFFGQSYTQAWVNSNGTLTFGQGNTSYTGSYGDFLAGPAAIAGAFTDLDPSTSTDGVRVLRENGRIVVSWTNIPLAGSAGFAIPPLETFQIKLYPDNHFELTYRISNLPHATVGITSGNLTPATLVDFDAAPSGVLGPVAEVFASTDEIDVVYAAQKFYQTHDDSYDYLVFYNASEVSAGSGVVAYELTTRSTTKGIGDTATDIGASFGSPRRLKAVLNLGPITQYPLNPRATVPARYPTGDTPMTILGHEAGHLYLALVSVPDPTNPSNLPMLGRAQVHWAFTFNSEASFLEGNRIRDDGTQASPRFTTTDTVLQYSPLDQYLMGFRAPDEVASMFTVLNASQAQTRAPQSGVAFTGTRLDVSIADIVKAAGRRTPDSTVAQRQFRMAFVLIVPAGSNLADNGVTSNAIAQVERYRSEFPAFFAAATGNRAAVETTIRQSVTLSLAPGAGVVQGASGLASVQLAHPAPASVTFSLRTRNGILSTPTIATIAAGQTRTTFPTFGGRTGVEELTAVPSDTRYESAVARVQVAPLNALHLTIASGDGQIATGVALSNPVVVRAVDQNNLPYSNVKLSSQISTLTDEFGYASFLWAPPATGGALDISIDGVANSTVSAFAIGKPAISSVVNAASLKPGIAPGSFVTILGANLGGASLTLNGAPVATIFNSTTQVNFLAPASVSTGLEDLVVSTRAGASSPVKVQFDTYAPGIFFDSASGYGAVLIAGTSNVTQIQPAKLGDYLEIYATGLGSGAAKVIATVGGINVPVVYSGPSSIPGLDQIDIQLALTPPPGVQPLSISVAGIASNIVNIQIAQ